MSDSTVALSTRVNSGSNFAILLPSSGAATSFQTSSPPPSNASARAASVVHHFARAGISPARLSVLGFGEYRPSESNDTVAGRNANRRVVIVILAGDGAPAPSDAAGMSQEIPQPVETLAVPGEAAQPEDLAQPEAAPVNPVTSSGPAAAVNGTEPAPLPLSVGAGAGIPAQE